MEEKSVLSFSAKEFIDKGWSKDKKYLVTDEEGNKYLLRISSIELYDRKKKQFEYMKQVAALGIPMCKPISFGSLCYFYGKYRSCP